MNCCKEMRQSGSEVEAQDILPLGAMDRFDLLRQTIEAHKDMDIAASLRAIRAYDHHLKRYRSCVAELERRDGENQ